VDALLMSKRRKTNTGAPLVLDLTDDEDKQQPAALAAPALKGTQGSSSSSSSSSSNGSAQPPHTAPAAPVPTPESKNYKHSAEYLHAVSQNQKALKRLEAELKTIKASGIECSLCENDLFRWELALKFDQSSDLGKDLQALTGQQLVRLRVHFDKSHPFQAPKVGVRWPRFLVGSTYVLKGGAVCMDLLSISGWSPALTVEKLAVAIQSLLLTPEVKARLDPKDFNREYSEAEFAESYHAMLEAHPTWQVGGAAAAGAAASHKRKY